MGGEVETRFERVRDSVRGPDHPGRQLTNAKADPPLIGQTLLRGETVSDLRPEGLGPRGLALWAHLTAGDLDAARRVLAGEACRLADRLDKLDGLLSGEVDVWARLTHRLMTDDYELKIDAAAAEARQAASVLRQILSQLAVAAPAASPGGSIADELEARRAARSAGA